VREALYKKSFQEFTVSDIPCALIVEDDAHHLMAISNLLNEMGIKFKRNTTGADVTQQALGMNPSPDFILLDLDLPQGDPFEIYSALRAHNRLNHVPVIALVDQNAACLLPDIEHHAFYACLPKPLPRKQFGLLMQELVGNRLPMRSQA
jgi:CheY-like chemotaxis protein